MASQLFSLGKSDFVKGLVVAVLAALFMQLSTLLNAPGFEFSTVNWGGLLQVALSAGIGYLSKNFLSDSDGKILGKI